MISVTVVVVARYDARATLSVFVGGAVCRIVTATDTRARPSRLDELDVVVVPTKNIRQYKGAYGKESTYPTQTLPCGFPFPPAPPELSY